MPNQFFSPEGDIENYFVTEYWLIDQYIGDELWIWGNGFNGRLGDATLINNSTPVTTFAGGTNWKQVSVGGGHVAAIKTDGTLWTWGTGTNGQRGDASTLTNRSTPVTIFAGGNNWKQVSAGNFHTAAIKTDGTLWTWGLGLNGQLGNANVPDRSTPVTTFAGGNNWKQVSSGNTHTAAIKTDGTLWTWGNSQSGQLGENNENINKSTPVTTFAGGTNWADTATTEPEDLYTLNAGNNHTAAVKTDGTLWIWGNGGVGALGNVVTTGIRSTPITTFAGGTNWKQVSAGNNHTAAIKTDGTLWTWGTGTSGVLGNALSSSRSTPVTTFAGGTNWKQVSSGNTHTAAIKTDGTLWTWGAAFSGQLGNADETNRLTPVTTFAGGTDWKQVSGGSSHTAAIKTDGTLWIWGNGSQGALGNTQTTNRSTPVTTFAGGTNWKQVSCGGSHTAAIKTDGTLWTWGNGTNGQRGNQSSVTVRSTPLTTFAGGTNWKQVSAGNLHTAAIKTDGTLWTWGNGIFSQLGNAQVTDRLTPVTTFAGGTNWKQVSAGGSHTAALKDTGGNKELFTWGFGFDGRLGAAQTILEKSTPVTTFAGGNNWKQVSAGNVHTAAIKTDGTLWTWGNVLSGRLGNNFSAFNISISTPVTTFAGGTNWKQVTTGTEYTAAIKTDGTLWTWGNGNSGALGNAVTTGNINTPVTTFAGGTNWKQVSAGTNHTAAIKTDGTLWTWGNGTNGKLGNAVTTNTSTPITTFAGGRNWKQVSSVNTNTAAVTTGISPDLPLS
jgi:alpha-tubulin suppressor-like RCC1 family protein